MSINHKILKDPQFNLTAKQRRLVMHRASKQWFKQPLNILIYISFCIFWMGSMVFLPHTLRSFGLSKGVVDLVIWAAFYPAMFLAFYYVFFNFRLMKHLYHELRKLGHHICPKCGYALSNLPDTESHCPECGAPMPPLPHEELTIPR